MLVYLGNEAPLLSRKDDTDYSKSDRAALEKAAAKNGVSSQLSTSDSTPVDDDLLRARLNGRTISEPMDSGATHTTIGNLPEDFIEALTTIRHLWSYHSASPPTWVAGDNDEFVKLLAANFKCPVGAPEDYEL